MAEDWYNCRWRLGLASWLVLVWALANSRNDVFAQITPDRTLGDESSVVTPNESIKGVESDRIEGGAIRGANLFHSFEQFNVSEGKGAYFTNPTGVENILSRVTGNNPSNILGRLGVLGGNANLFLINPNGVIFGENASLDVRGSFIVTTANAVGLGERGFFSASEPETSNLLEVDPSALFFNAVAAQNIVNQSQASGLSGETNSIGDPVGLQVPTDKTLALIGGNAILSGGNLTAAGGQIELGSVSKEGEVSLEKQGETWRFGYDRVDNFGDIRLQDGAIVDATGESGGKIQIHASRLEMTQRAFIFSDTQGTGEGEEIFVRTSDAIALSKESRITADVLDTATGNGGDITLETERLSLRDGSLVSVSNASSTSSNSQSGDLKVNVSESIELIGVGISPATGQLIPSSLFAQTEGVGNAGNLTIKTGRLLVRDGAIVSTNTFGEGRGRNLTVTANLIDLAGTSPNGIPGGLFAETGGTEGTGDAGNLIINTGRLVIRDGAVVSASTFSEGRGGNLTVTASDSIDLEGFLSGLFAQSQIGTGDAGNLTIKTGHLNIQDGAQVSASTFSEGKGGNLTVTASDFIDIKGASPDGEFLSGLFVQSRGTGNAGTLDVTAKTIRLDDRGVIRANTRSSQGGDITLEVRDLLLLSGGSRISAAGVPDTNGTTLTADEGSFGNGGNITINIPFIISVPEENSDIVANASTGRGGNITINTSGLFGIEERDPRTSFSDINASSELGIDGIVEINRIDFDPTREAITIPSLQTEAQIVQACQPGENQAQSQFIVVGRGGLPDSPSQTLSSDTIKVDWVTIAPQTTQEQNNEDVVSTSRRDRIVEAQGWKRDRNGKTVLIASTSNTQSQGSRSLSNGCPATSSN
jgi:filamentous hemagglutinin family protein